MHSELRSRVEEKRKNAVEYMSMAVESTDEEQWVVRTCWHSKANKQFLAF